MPVDLTDPRNHAIGWGVLDQILKRASLPLGSDDQRAILDKRVGVTQVSNVLACSALAGLATPGHGVGPSSVKRDGVARYHLGEVRADVVQVLLHLSRRLGNLNLDLLDEGEGMDLDDGITFGHDEPSHDPARFSWDDVLHLH